MIFHIFTIFPEVFKEYFNTSIIVRAQKKKLIKIKVYDIRKFAKDKHRTTDDRPFGGGAGMVLKIEPIIKAVSSILNSKFEIRNSKFIILSPAGKKFDQKMAKSYANKYENIILLCGHYEGIDERIKKIVSDFGFRISDLSIGPYILTGGELPAAVVVDTISRHIPGVLGKEESLEEIKGSYPVYTRPEIFEYKGKKYRAPRILLSGDHKKIEAWRKSHSKSTFV